MRQLFWVLRRHLFQPQGGCLLLSRTDFSDIQESRFVYCHFEIPTLLFPLIALYRLWNKNYIKEVPNDPENELYGGYFPPGGGLKSPKGDPRD